MYELIEKLMKNKNITATELSKATGISSQLLSIWKQKKIEPKVENLKKLAEFFDVPITYFFTGEIIEKAQDKFSSDEILLAREINKSDKLELLRDIMKIQKESDVKVLKELTKIFLERK